MAAKPTCSVAFKSCITTRTGAYTYHTHERIYEAPLRSAVLLARVANDVGRKRIGMYLLPKQLYIASTSIKAQAQRDKLYGSDEREGVLSKIESSAAVVLQRMVNKLELPNSASPDHSTLLVYLLFQSMRTPTAVAQMEGLADQMMRLIMSRDEKMAPNLDLVQVKINDAAVRALSMAVRAIPLTADLHYKLLHNQTAVPFIISDHPVAKYNQFMERRRIEFGCTGFGCRALQMFLPISPTLTLMFYDPDVYRVGRQTGNNVVPVDRADVDVLNVLQVVNAGSQLFFNTEMKEEMVRDLVDRSRGWLLKERGTLKEFPQRPTEPGTRRSIVITSLKDIRIGMKLSSIVELPSAQKYRVVDGMSLIRNPKLYELHAAFEGRVETGLYSPNEFHKYIEDAYVNKIR